MTSNPHRIARAAVGAVLALTAVLAASSCSAPALSSDPADDGELRVATTTGILADLVRNVAGDRATVTQMVPDGADPHSWEPSLRTIRDVAYADVAFSNYLLLEEHAIIRALDANLPPTATSVSVAEEAAKEGATILPLIEDRSLDTVWLGMRVLGTGSQYGADRASTIDLIATGVDGPGDAASYLTTSFGAPDIGFASSDGFDPASGYADDTSVLPADAHQHMSWAFTAPGVYRIPFEARLRAREGDRPVVLDGATAVFAVGVAPDEVAAAEGRRILSAGHADITVDLERGGVALAVDEGALAPAPGGGPDDEERSSKRDAPLAPGMEVVDLDDVVIDVPTRTLTQIPGAPGFRFLGAPGSDAYVLPQAVLGKHVHGEIDPHLWHDAHNAAAYVRVIRDALIAADPDGADDYRRNAAAYAALLDEVDAEVAATIATIPPERRRLVTTNDAYGYLANAYGLDVAGFVAPNPGVEPSVADRIRLAATLDDLDIPAVFLEPNLARTRSTLRTTAQEAGVRVCPLYGDTLDATAPTYVDMMRFNAQSLARCLGGHDPEEE
ncbi:anchored repeat ABC transporter, substrate-binding protein [Actinomyces sp. B33]|uniref:anchored repeat ABC transporter, substrate-binding protein n=1 Tax=Actinomyces sp. B33 TaxID=2942131 RepID=UPI0023422E09|nr:anchored repeat ABC transporter, substrate-binding protein [Actinomyces sp. B33]MDC4232529.1 anchored repeat ABC transporter, substrate-binding protein [Actinomyces sp. B33]